MQVADAPLGHIQLGYVIGSGGGNRQQGLARFDRAILQLLLHIPSNDLAIDRAFDRELFQPLIDQIQLLASKFDLRTKLGFIGFRRTRSCADRPVCELVNSLTTANKLFLGGVVLAFDLPLLDFQIRVSHPQDDIPLFHVRPVIDVDFQHFARTGCENFLLLRRLQRPLGLHVKIAGDNQARQEQSRG